MLQIYVCLIYDATESRKRDGKSLPTSPPKAHATRAKQMTFAKISVKTNDGNHKDKDDTKEKVNIKLKIPK